MARGSLKKYQSKRDFARTAEPAGGGLKESGDSFVVQKHAARRLHYDFRLEHDGVLASWAVPQGPSLDPHVKRLAVRTEDHPLEYGSFEGTIPKGQYGGGSVIIWDRGRVRWLDAPAPGFKKGHLKFALDGERLHGAFSLVRMKGREGERGENWLLIKSADEETSEADPTKRFTRSVVSHRSVDDVAEGRGAKRVWRSRPAVQKRPVAAPEPRGPAPTAKFVEPALATLVDAAPAGDEWLHEMKFDGYRLQAAVRNARVKLYTRSGQDWTDRFPGLVRALAAMKLPDVLLDGEAAAADAKGRTDFSALQAALHEGGEDGISFFVFDLLAEKGKSLRARPLVARKKRLAALLKSAPPPIFYSDHIIGHGPETFAVFCEKGLEGVVSKRADAPYRSGRGGAWLKAKCSKRREFVIGGYARSDKRAFSSLLLGEYEAGKLIYRGKIGTGFDDATLESLLTRFSRLQRKTMPFEDVPRVEARGAIWLDPKLVAEARYAELTRDGRIRQGAFLGLREDKKARDVRAETETPAHLTNTGEVQKAKAGKAPAMRLTHPEKLMYPEDGITKADVARYLEAAADRMAPYACARPVSLLRCPDGAKDKDSCFFQKHAMPGMPKAIATMPIKESSGKAKDYLVLPDKEALLSCAQIGALEVHLWGSRADDVEKPDRMVFDLDPDEGVPFATVRDAAREIRDMLDHAGLKSFAMLSGGKGVHVVLPLARRHSWDDVSAFAAGVAQKAADLAPDRYVATMSKAKRVGRIFIDHFRNGRGATSVAPYSLRARKGAPVAMPVSWDELKSSRAGSDFKLEDAAKRAQSKSDPWADYAKSAQTLSAAAWKALDLKRPK